MWIYVQSSGDILDPDAKKIGRGYSGRGKGRNNPSMEHVPNTGPIPAGDWKIVGKPFDSPKNGKFCLRLVRLDGTKAHGRDGFLWHGDNAAHDASEGCIISAYGIRAQVYASGDHLIRVVPGK